VGLVERAGAAQPGRLAPFVQFVGHVVPVVVRGTQQAPHPVTADAVEAARDGFDLETLVIGRHRARRLLGSPHDDWDDVADELHERRQTAWLGRARSLDEAHDPLRLKRLKEGGAAALDAEIAALTDTLDELRPAPTTPRKTCVLYWPPDEFTKLLEHRPKAAEAYGDDHADHRRQVERTLQELSEKGVPHLAVGPATLAGLEAHADSITASPDTSDTRSAYAAELARTGRTTDWPPPRNGPCWCGSDRKYKKCCGNPALA
jgi:hypothetical protein